MTTFKDKSGAEVEAGDFIVYATVRRRDVFLRYGKVMEVTTRERYGNKRPCLKVVGTDLATKYFGQNSKQTLELQRVSIIDAPSRILIINEDQISPEALALLDTIEA